ncbi:(R)-mandelonitrile lyase [Neisseria sp. Ec49-e6-T10]|uniref:(R)-mandelonitrile lyase n=1 Tax=Neisseria sp. Ec49-e6-T10 TaxID=3140744 RepID=UPI003EBCCCB7
MKKHLITLILSAFFASSLVYAAEPVNTQTVLANGSQAAYTGPAEFFTGSVKVQPLFPVAQATNVSGAYVTFDAGARSAWHTHPAGQTLVVTEGVGWTQVWGGEIKEVHVGDVIICPPGVKHWHGATPNSTMTHLTVTGDLNGQNVHWLEKVSDEQYKK